MSLKNLDYWQAVMAACRPRLRGLSRSEPMPTNLVTDGGLLKRLTDAARRGVSASERRQQRLSFVYGNLPRNSGMTRHDVERELARIDEQDGKN